MERQFNQQDRIKTDRLVSRSNGSLALKGDEVAAVVGGHLRRLRDRRNLSLEALSKLSGVSRAMLGQIEQGRSAPTIKVLSRIAAAFGVPVSSFLSSQEDRPVVVLRPHETKLLKSTDGKFSSRALFPFGSQRRVEFYELRLEGQSTEHADAHAPGTTENLVVDKGSVEIRVDGVGYGLSAGDAIYFKADTPHSYHNLGADTAVIYLVMAYAESVTY